MAPKNSVPCLVFRVPNYNVEFIDGWDLQSHCNAKGWRVKNVLVFYMCSILVVCCIVARPYIRLYIPHIKMSCCASSHHSAVTAGKHQIWWITRQQQKNWGIYGSQHFGPLYSSNRSSSGWYARSSVLLLHRAQKRRLSDFRWRLNVDVYHHYLV